MAPAIRFAYPKLAATTTHRRQSCTPSDSASWLGFALLLQFLNPRVLDFVTGFLVGQRHFGLAVLALATVFALD